MKHFNRLLWALFLLPAFSLAQSNYKPGQVVTLKGDTLKGFIDYRGWDSNPSAISFKTAADDNKPQKFTVNDISYFNISGLEAYQKFTCSITMDETNPSRISTGLDTSNRIAAVFLKILQKGKNAALYAYTDDMKTRFYIGETPDYRPFELVYRIYYDNNAATYNHGTVNENIYLKQLFALANRYNALDDNLTPVLQTANYQKNDLLAIVSRINNISAAEFQKKYNEHAKISLYGGAALNISATSAPAASSYTTGGGKPTTSYLPAFSFGVDINPNPAAGNVEFRLDLSLALSKFKSVYQLKVSPFTTNTASFNQTTITLTPQVIYNFYNTPAFKIYIGAGLALNHSGFSNVFFGNPQNPNADGPNLASEPYYFNNNDDSFLLKAGFKSGRKWEVFFNYYTPMAIARGGYFGFDNVTKQIGVSYFFGE